MVSEVAEELPVLVVVVALSDMLLGSLEELVKDKSGSLKGPKQELSKSSGMMEPKYCQA